MEKEKEKKNDKNQVSIKIDGAETASTQNDTKTKHIEWSPENEMIMVEWCDIAQCYKWMNTRSHIQYSYMHAWFTIPAITLSTITGTASFAQASLPENYQLYAPAVIGTINIFIGILTTVQQYLKISELNEAHRVSAISWDKFARNIRIELSKLPSERMDAGQFIKLSRQEFDRLMETSPSISEWIIKEFEKSFKGKDGTLQRKRFEALKKPDICNNIVSAGEYRHPWYLDINTIDIFDYDDNEKEIENFKSKEEEMIEKEKEYFKSKEEEIIEKERRIHIKETEEKEKNEKKIALREKFQKKIVDASNKLKFDMKHIEDFVNKFEIMYHRKPVKDEIENHAEELIQDGKIDRNVVKKFFEKNIQESAENNV